MTVRIIRIFNTYGPRMDPGDGRVVSNFIVQALKGQPLTIYGDGLQTRSFCFVSDLIDGMMRLMDYEGDDPGPVNVGNPDEYSMRQLAEAALKLTGSKSPLETHPLPADDPTRRRPDISKARRLLGWEPRVDLDTGLKQTVAYYRGLVEEGRA